MKISFLIHNAYGIGGTIRSTVNLSAALAERHDVEVVSVHRTANAPALPFHRRVRLTSLIDMREESPSYEGGHALSERPNSMFPDTGVDFGRLRYTALHDERIAGHLAATGADVVIATRPILNGYLARYGQSRYLRVGQEHLTLERHSKQLRADQNAAIKQLDLFITVSEADAAAYRTALPETAERIICIPNTVPVPAVSPSHLDSKTIVAAGRLVSVKRYDRLIDAFAKLAPAHPDWNLRIYGRGPQAKKLRKQVDDLGLYNRILLPGRITPIETEWAKGAIAAVSSDAESFGMTIVEAMHCGVPVVATDCPHGPGEIITHNTDGLLVDLDGGTDAFATALHTLIDDVQLRHRLAEAARERAAAYTPFTIAHRYEEHIGALLGERYRKRITTRPQPSLTRRLLTHISGPKTARPHKPLHRWASTALRAPAPVRPAARARVDGDGSLTIALNIATLPSGRLDFLARLRHDTHDRTVRLPVPAPETSHRGYLTITLPRSELSLNEGRWDCYTVPRRTGKRRRLRAELVEQAALLTLPPRIGKAGLTSWIPYTTTDGYLAIRAWRRPAHAEIDHIHIGDSAATVTATLLGDATLHTTRSTITATTRSHHQPATFTLPIHPLTDSRFHFTLPYDKPMTHRTAQKDIWDLHLQLTTTAEPIPIGRITGDLTDRKKTSPLPARHLPHPERGTTRIRPYYTTTNDLALSLRDTQT